MDRKVTTVLYVFVNLLICALALNETRDFGDVSNKAKESDFPERKWISQLFYEAETAFNMDSNVSTKCKEDYLVYLRHLSNQSIWAIRMMESSEWPSVGIFNGMVDHLGNFDECLSVSMLGVKGQYCLAETTYDYQEASKHHENPEEYPNQAISVWDALRMYQSNPVRIDRRRLSYALCIPSSCTASDLKRSLNSTLYPIFRKNGFNISVNVNPTFCKIRSEYNYSQGYYVVRWVFVALFLVVISSTCYDIAMYSTDDDNPKEKKKEEKGGTLSIYRSFSIVHNFQKLKHVDPKVDFAAIHFVKVLNILFVIYGHRFIYFIGYPKFNGESAEAAYTTSSLELIHTNVVDVFFMVSGFLSFHFGLLPMLKGGVFYLFFSVLFRWIRMIPVFIILMLYVIYILPYTSEGPLWEYRVMNEVNKCKESWWANLLVVNNIVNTDQQCLVISWYISADIQLAIIGGIILFIFTKNRKAGIIASLIALFGFTIVTFTVAYINKFHGLLRLYMSLLEEPRREEEFTNFYVATYTRAGPYLIGFIAGYITKILKERELKLTNKQVALIAFITVLIGEGSQYYGCLFYLFGREYNPVESALYAATNRSLFVLGYAVLFVLYFTSGLGFLTRFIEWKVFVPFGRLTYSVFLVNTVIQLYHAASQKQLMPSSTRMNLIWWVFADVMWSYMIGLVLHLFAEAPISNLSKLLQKNLINALGKPRRSHESIHKINPNVEANEPSNEKSINIISNGNCQFGYHNESYVNEIVPKISESSKF